MAAGEVEAAREDLLRARELDPTCVEATRLLSELEAAPATERE